MNRREALELLASLPAVTSIKRADITPTTVVVLECDGAMSAETAERLQEYWRQVFPDIPCVVLSDGLRMKVLDKRK